MQLLYRLLLIGICVVACSSQYAQAKTFNLDEGRSSVHYLLYEEGRGEASVDAITLYPRHGEIDPSSPRAIRYKPHENFCGQDSVRYRVVFKPKYDIYPPELPIAMISGFGSITNDNRVHSSIEETVTYNVRCINDPTLLELPSSVDVNVGGTKTVDIHASDVDSSDFSIAVVSSSNSALLPIGNITLTQNEQIRYEGGLYQASWQMNIRPLADMAGYATVQLQSTDSAGLTKTYTVDIYVRPRKLAN
ncbi:hypothetical protein, partial [Pseudoalteromonas piscicida]